MKVSAQVEQQLTSWMLLKPSERPDPHLVISAFGLAWGQQLAADADLEWAAVRHATDTEFVLVDAAGVVWEMPVRQVSERWKGQSAKPLRAEGLRAGREGGGGS